MVHHLFDVIEIRLRLERIVHTVVSGVEKLLIVHIRVVTEMRVARGFHKSVSHERAGRDDGLHDARFNQIAKNQPHLAHRQSARERHDHKTILVAGHLLKNIGGIADLPAGERRVAHGAHQFIDRAALG